MFFLTIFLYFFHYSHYYQVIEMTQRVAEHRAQSLLRELEEEISVLNRRSTALSQLALSEDYIHFFRVWMNDGVNRM